MTSTTRFDQAQSFAWEFQNFPRLHSLDSPDFFVENAVYRLKLSYGATPCDGKCLQIRLERVSGDAKRCYVCVDLSRETQKQGYKPYKTMARGFDKGVACVFLLPEAELVKPDEEVIANGGLKIVLTIDNLDPTPQDPDRRKAWFGMSTSTDVLCRDLRGLMVGGRHPDVVVKCGKRYVFAHTPILFARSRILEIMYRECQETLLTLNEMDAPVFAPLLSYLYTGTVGDVTHVDLSKLCTAAARYGLEDLKNKCFLAMRANLGKKNVYEYLLVSDNLSNFDFKTAAVAYLVEADEMLDSEEWKEFFQRHSKLGNEVLRAVLDKKSRRISFLKKINEIQRK